MLHNLRFGTALPNPLRLYTLSWDDETGALIGEHAEDIKYWSKTVIEDGVIPCDAINGEIPATNPLTNKAEFCALIGLDNLPDSLKPFYPTRDYPGFVSFDESEDIGAIIPDASILY